MTGRPARTRGQLRQRLDAVEKAQRAVVAQHQRGHRRQLGQPAQRRERGAPAHLRKEERTQNAKQKMRDVSDLSPSKPLQPRCERAQKEPRAWRKRDAAHLKAVGDFGEQRRGEGLERRAVFDGERTHARRLRQIHARKLRTTRCRRRVYNENSKRMSARSVTTKSGKERSAG